MSEPTGTRWTTVYIGSMSDVLVCQGLLESNGIPAHILDQNIKVMDPFITGVDALGVHLQVADTAMEEAREILAWRPPASEKAGEPREPDRERVEKLGSRLRWASIALLTAPFALFLAPSYLRGASALDRSPRNHGWTVAAIVFGVILTMIALVRILRAAQSLA